MRPIPIDPSKAGELVEILTPETSVFSLFIPLTQVSEELCPFPQNFIEDLVRQIKFFHEKGMRYIFATDAQAMSIPQYKKTQEILSQIGVEMLDISTLPGYMPYDKTFSRSGMGRDAKTLYAGDTQNPGAEYIDKTKVMLASLAGTPPWKNVLVTDFDI